MSKQLAELKLAAERAKADRAALVARYLVTVSVIGRMVDQLGELHSNWRRTIACSKSLVRWHLCGVTSRTNFARRQASGEIDFESRTVVLLFYATVSAKAGHGGSGLGRWG